ncbi:hypothetical protein Taro_051528 [Colocasia esculenta]|uniref:Uncharacterized protein n=1 Tax=Colocasia esculenta TaxID=4460 RepID=A0A843XG84_COLES|nr:hypothetical protein [Colocasia esculenta]
MKNERESLRESSPHEISSSLTSPPSPATLGNELGPAMADLGEYVLAHTIMVSGVSLPLEINLDSMALGCNADILIIFTPAGK